MVLIAQNFTQPQAALVGMAVVFLFFLVFGIFLYIWWLRGRYTSHSPYTGMPLRHAVHLPFYAKEKIAEYLAGLHQYDNRVFLFRKAALCRETGRIFPKSVNFLNIISVDWDFIQRRHKGSYVSWGSLSEDQKRDIRNAHESLEGYQTEQSSKNPSPRLIEPEFVFLKPGPLYVDIDTKILVGWKEVPGTELEVLIVQKPKNMHPK